MLRTGRKKSLFCFLLEVKSNKCVTLIQQVFFQFWPEKMYKNSIFFFLWSRLLLMKANAWVNRLASNSDSKITCYPVPYLTKDQETMLGSFQKIQMHGLTGMPVILIPELQVNLCLIKDPNAWINRDACNSDSRTTCYPVSYLTEDQETMLASFQKIQMHGLTGLPVILIPELHATLCHTLLKTRKPCLPAFKRSKQCICLEIPDFSRLQI